MDSARDRMTGRIVCGIELWLLEKVDWDNYECTSCGLTLRPISFKKDVNLYRPYFRKDPDASHHPNCGKIEAQKRKADARKKSITGTLGFPLSYPNRLVLDDFYHLTGRSRGGRSPKPPAPRNGGTSPNGTRPKHHDHTTDTIRPLAHCYVDFPHDRQNLRLSVPGVEGSTYEEAFQYLYFAEGVYYRQAKIFYGSLNFKRTELHDNFADVILSEGLWEVSGGKNVLAHPYVVRINLEGWSDYLRECVLDEINLTRKEIMKRVHEGEKNVKGWFFFLGIQDPSNRFLFHVADYRLICCLSDVMVRKSVNRKGSSVLASSILPNAVGKGVVATQQILSASKAEAANNPATPAKVTKSTSVPSAPAAPEAIRRTPPASEIRRAEQSVPTPLAKTPYRTVSQYASSEKVKPPIRVDKVNRLREHSRIEGGPDRLQPTSGLAKIRQWLHKIVGW